MTPLRIFIGYDSREPIAFHVLAHSLMRHATQPIAIYPLSLAHLKRAYWRERGSTESTEFSLTRFLVPYLCGFQGTAIFMDCDMLCQADITKLPEYLLPGQALAVCRHEYTPAQTRKFLDQHQTQYPRKNWSSLMVFDTERCQALTPEYVNDTATGLMLHRFWWLDDAELGSIPLDWNWLVGEYAPNAEARMLHWTNGGPWFSATKDCDHADLWREELRRMGAEPMVA